MSAPEKHGVEPIVVMQYDRGPFGVDASLAPLVKALNAAGIMTVASCSGHGHRPGSIALRDGRELLVLPNFEAARELDRLWPDIHGERAPVACFCCGQTDIGQYGEYPCAVCGLPTLWDLPSATGVDS